LNDLRVGPTTCYFHLNQSGAGCFGCHSPSPGHHCPWSPHLGQGEPEYRANNRLLDAGVSAGATNSSVPPAAADRIFSEAWSTAEAARAAGSWDATTAWRQLVAALPAELRLAPVAAARCGGGGSVMGATAGGDCLLATARV
jgi:hypothetical protein